MRSIIKNKKAIIGEIMTTFIATIIIIIILVVFALGSFALREIKNIKGDTKILDDSKTIPATYVYFHEIYPPWACLGSGFPIYRGPGETWGGNGFINGECICDTSRAFSKYNPNKNEPPCILK